MDGLMYRIRYEVSGHASTKWIEKTITTKLSSIPRNENANCTDLVIDERMYFHVEHYLKSTENGKRINILSIKRMQ